MLHRLRLPAFLAGLLLLLSPTARASHAQGGQLTYEYVGTAAQPNRYKVTCRFFRDCSGIDVPTSFTLNCRVGTPTTSCTSNDSRNFTATLVRGISTFGAPYCSSVGNQCSAAGRPNFETAKYEAVVTLPPAPSWALSVEENARPSMANIPGNTNLYLETTLNNQLTLASGSTLTINNTSPQYLDQNVLMPLVCVRQRTTLNFSAIEPDGDSLVYSLDRPLDGCNQPSTYKTLTLSTGFPVSTNPPCVAIGPTSVTFSPTFPIPSFSVSGNCPIRTATPFFTFNPQQGSFTFEPAFYDAAVPANNKYVVVGKVTEYRRINGRYYLVGSVRRDMLVVVTDCGGNQVPNPPSLMAGQPGPPTDSLLVEAPIQTDQLTDFYLTDPNAGDQLTVVAATPNTDPYYLSLYTNPAAPALPVTVLANGTTAPVLRVHLRPDPSVIGRTYRIPVQVMDNACPIRATQNFVLILRGIAPRPTATQSARQRGLTNAFPNPFTGQVSFTLPRPRVAQPVRVYDPLGRVVAELALPAGTGTDVQLTWRPAPTLPAGVYTARAAAGGPSVRLLRVQP